jgi:hypothetical protein
MKMAKSPFFKKDEAKLDSARMHRSISPDKYGASSQKGGHNSLEVPSQKRGNSRESHKSMATVNRRAGNDSNSVRSRKVVSQAGDFDRKTFNPYFFKEAAQS